MEEGKRKAIIETAKTALSEGLSVELVAKITGLSIEEVEQLK